MENNSKDTGCTECGGLGYVEWEETGVEAGCCGHFLPTGECCGNAVPVAVQLQAQGVCPKCRGS